MRMTATGILLLAAALAVSSPARAQSANDSAVSAPSVLDAPSAPAAPSGGRSAGARAFGAYEYDIARPSVAFQDELGSSKFSTLSGGVDITGLWRQVFLRVDLAHLSGSGSRGFTNGSGQFVSLNIPMTVSMTPIDIGAGWRIESRGVRERAATPYVGAGVVFMKYSETSANSISGEDVSATYKGFFVLVGVDVPVTRVLSIGGEGVFRSVPITPATNTLLDVLNERNLGGAAIRVTFSVKY